MADMYGAVRSDWFCVKDPDKFRLFFDKYKFGSEIEIWQNKEDPSCFAFGGEEQYPSAFPQIETEDGFEDADLEQFCKEMQTHLKENERFVVVAAGNEKLRYVACNVLFVSNKGFDWFSISSDSADTVEALFDLAQ